MVDEGETFLLSFTFTEPRLVIEAVLQLLVLQDKFEESPWLIPFGLAVKLLIVGEFWDDKKVYLAIIQQLGIAGNVIIIDKYVPNEDIGRYFAASIPQSWDLPF